VKSKSFFALLVLVAAFVSVGSAAAPSLKFKFKDVVAGKATETDSYAINNKGVIAGDYVDSSAIQHAMILAGKKVTTVDRADCLTTAGATGIQFYGINSAGVAAGWCTNTSNVQIGFTWAKGKFTDINLSASLTNANGINDKGEVVGTYVDSSGVQHGFLKVGKKVTNLDPPGVVSLATAWGINNKGVVTVWGLNASNTYVSFTTANKGKTYKPFHAPKEGTTGTAIHSNNNKGDVVATYWDSSSLRHGVLFHKGKYYSFDDPKGKGQTRGDGLNDTLGIVGRYSPTSSTNAGFFAQAK
jgi:probable HAF family extracellular repeat protein